VYKLGVSRGRLNLQQQYQLLRLLDALLLVTALVRHDAGAIDGIGIPLNSVRTSGIGYEMFVRA
jgi:hypothetical protein